jgi:dihydropyrimidinase
VARTIIINGNVVSASGTHQATVVVDGETISALLNPGTKEDLAVRKSKAKVIDAKGKYVIPGGIDVHTHMEMPFGGTYSSDTFETGSRAAAWGGTTTIIDFAVQQKGGSLQSALDAWQEKAKSQCAIDYGFHMIVADVNNDSLKEMESLVSQGVTSFKLFTAYPGVLYSTDGEIYRAMQRAAQIRAMIMMHCENGIVIDEIVKDHVERGETDPVYHSISRPVEMEAEATYRCIQMAKIAGCQMYVVHLSCQEALDHVMDARDKGFPIYTETCPQYLFRSIDDLAREGFDGFEGANFVCSTPLRSKEQHEKLWRGIRFDDIAVVSTDHCPFCFKDQKILGKGNFAKIPNGMAGVEHRMDLLYKGVTQGNLSVERWVEIAATTPARLFGMYPKKGVIAPGSDADIVIYDPKAKQKLGVKNHHMNVDYSAYEGEQIDGRCDLVMSRGNVIIEDKKYVGTKGDGKFISRGLSQKIA